MAIRADQLGAPPIEKKIAGSADRGFVAQTLEADAAAAGLIVKTPRQSGHGQDQEKPGRQSSDQRLNRAGEHNRDSSADFQRENEASRERQQHLGKQKRPPASDLSCAQLDPLNPRGG